MISLDVKTSYDVALELAARVKARRLELDLTQEGLARKAGMKLPTYRKFERTGEISLRSLLNIAFALDMLDNFEDVFAERRYRNMDEFLNEPDVKRQRGKLK